MSLDLCRIGQLLKEAREGRGLTLEEVSEALFLRKRVLGAIEAGDWDNLPHPVYVKGYVTQYASFLDIADLPLRGAAMGEDEPQAPGKDDLRKRDFQAMGVQEREGTGPWPRERALERHRPAVRGILRWVTGALFFQL